MQKEYYKDHQFIPSYQKPRPGSWLYNETGEADEF